MAVDLIPRRLQFSVEQFDQMGAAGIFSDRDRLELIEGEIICMSPIGFRHGACVARLTRGLCRKLGERGIVWVQSSIRLGDRSEPQPDIAVLKPREDFYSTRHPEAKDIFLIIEVAESSLEYDCSVKAPLYARHGIPEVWVVDLLGDRILVYQQPSDTGFKQIAETRTNNVLMIPFLKVSLTGSEILG